MKKYFLSLVAIATFNASATYNIPLKLTDSRLIGPAFGSSNGILLSALHAYIKKNKQTKQNNELLGFNLGIEREITEHFWSKNNLLYLSERKSYDELLGETKGKSVFASADFVYQANDSYANYGVGLGVKKYKLNRQEMSYSYGSYLPHVYYEYGLLYRKNCFEFSPAFKLDYAVESFRNIPIEQQDLIPGARSRQYVGLNLGGHIRYFHNPYIDKFFINQVRFWYRNSKTNKNSMALNSKYSYIVDHSISTINPNFYNLALDLNFYQAYQNLISLSYQYTFNNQMYSHNFYMGYKAIF